LNPCEGVSNSNVLRVHSFDYKATAFLLVKFYINHLLGF
jgi:hypothetical protein